MMAAFFSMTRQAKRVRLVICVLLILLLVSACSGTRSQPGSKDTPAAQPTEPHETQCGDGLCEQGEKETCCMDCGCQEQTKICDRYFNKCIDKANLSDEKKNELLAKYKSWPLIEMTDDVYDHQAAKLFRFNCGDQSKTCEHLVYIDGNGAIIQEQETK